VIPRDAWDHGYLALEVDAGGRGFGGIFGGIGGWQGRVRRRRSRFGGGHRGDGELLGLLGRWTVLRLVFRVVLVFRLVLVFLVLVFRGWLLGVGLRGRLLVGGGRVVLGAEGGGFQAHGRHLVLERRLALAGRGGVGGLGGRGLGNGGLENGGLGSGGDDGLWGWRSDRGHEGSGGGRPLRRRDRRRRVGRHHGRRGGRCGGRVGRGGGRGGRRGGSGDTGDLLGGGSIQGPLPSTSAWRRGPRGGRWRASRWRWRGRERGRAARDIRRALGRALGGQVARAGRRGLRGGRGPGRGGRDAGLPGSNPRCGLPGRGVRGRSFRPGQLGLGRLRLGRSGLAEQLFPLDDRTNAQGQQGYAAHADRDIDQRQLAGDDPGDQ
jgi:hypothetical protein